MTEESDFLHRLNNGLWERELVKKASRIRSDFEAFLDQHGAEIRQQDVDQPIRTSIFFFFREK